MSKERKLLDKPEKSGYEKFNTGSISPDPPPIDPDAVIVSPGNGPSVPPEPQSTTPPSRDPRSPAIQAAAALVTGRPMPRLVLKPDAHPLLVTTYDLLSKFLAGHIIAPWAYLAQIEAEGLIDKIRKEIELIE